MNFLVYFDFSNQLQNFILKNNILSNFVTFFTERLSLKALVSEKFKYVAKYNERRVLSP